MAELKQIDPTIGTSVHDIPRLPNLSELGKLQKKTEETEGPDFKSYWKSYLNQTLAISQDATGRRSLFFGDMNQINEQIKRQKESDYGELMQQGRSDEALALSYDQYRVRNFSNILGSDAEEWFRANVNVPEEYAAVALNQLGEVYRDDFEEKFLAEQNAHKLQQHINMANQEITLEIGNGSIGLQRAINDRTVALNNIGKLKNDIAQKEEDGTPIDTKKTNALMAEYDAALVAADEDMVKAYVIFDQANNNIATGMALQYYDTEKGESLLGKAQVAKQSALNIGPLDALLGIMIEDGQNQILSDKLAKNTGSTEEDYNPISVRSEITLDLDSLKTLGYELSNQLQNMPGGANEAELRLLVDTWYNQALSIESGFRAQAVEMSNYNISEEWALVTRLLGASRLEGNIVPADIQKAALEELAKIEVMEFRGDITLEDANAIRRSINGFLSFAYGQEEEIPDVVKKALYMRAQTIEIDAWRAPTTLEDLTRNFNDVYVNYNGKRWDLPFSMFEKLLTDYDVSDQYQKITRKMSELVRGTESSQKARMYIDAGYANIENAFRNSLTADEALASYNLDILEIEKDTPSKRQQRRGTVHYDTTSGLYSPVVNTNSQAAQVLQDGHEYDHQYMGSMLSDEGWFLFANREIFEKSIQEKYPESKVDEQLSSMAPNINARITGFDAATNKYITAINKGIYETKLVNGVAVEGFLVNIFEQGYEANPYDPEDLYEDRPQLNMLGGQDENTETTYFLFTDPFTNEIDAKEATVRWDNSGKMVSLVLNESLDVKWGMNSDFRRETAPFGGRLVATNRSWENVQAMMMDYNRRTSQKLDPTGMPYSLIKADDRYQPLRTVYEQAEEYLGTERTVPALEVVTETAIKSTLSEEGVRFRALGLDKSIVAAEEESSGDFYLPTQTIQYQIRRVDRQGRDVIVDEEAFFESPLSKHVGMDFVRVPAEDGIANWIRNLYIEDPQRAQDEYLEILTGENPGAPGLY